MLPTLLFDLDGTLTDNFAGISRSIRHALAQLGVALPLDDALRACVGSPLRESVARLLATDDSAAIERALMFYRERYSIIGWEENRVYDGMHEALGEVSVRGARAFLCTSKPQPHAKKIVAHFGLDRHFDGIYGADLAGLLDDKSKLVAHVCAREACDAGGCVMIGDRAQDIRAAHANGGRAIGVLWGYGSREELEAAGADAIIRAPAELTRAINAFAERR